MRTLSFNVAFLCLTGLMGLPLIGVKAADSQKLHVSSSDYEKDYVQNLIANNDALQKEVDNQKKEKSCWRSMWLIYSKNLIRKN